MARYLVGIDLGTTHTVAAFAPVEAAGEPRPEIFEIEQLVAPAELGRRPLLPSLRYHPGEGEVAPEDVALPWPDPGLALQLPPGVIGELAREYGSRVPGRLVSSAKSWLSHRSVDRTEPILPWGAPEDVAKISPLHASASYLAHVRAAWNHRFPADPLQQQEVVLTVPASFDESARALTVQAAALAGISRVRLIEEPQAACYDWLAAHSHDLEDALGAVRLLLVCDVGGGTTDFTLIKVKPGGQAPDLVRIGVGDHLMLGGDNMDLALAHIAESRILRSGAKLGAASLSQLIQQCRAAKERLLAPGAPDNASVTVLGGGGRLVGGARSAALGREEVRQALVEGFFPRAGADETPRRLRGGIVEFGLPYAADPAVTRHLAAFLAGHAQACREALGLEDPLARAIPDAVLLNGGVFRSALLTDRLLDVLREWRREAVVQLENRAPDLAVARGAVAYGLARRGRGIRIGGGSARSYFLLLDSDRQDLRQAVCLLPRGTEEGKEISLPGRTFSLRLGQPVRFHLLSSTGDRAVAAGDVVTVDDEAYTQLPPVAAVLEDAAGHAEVPVRLAVALTDVGTLEVACAGTTDPARRWRFEFQLRGGSRAPVTITGTLHPGFDQAAALVERVYGSRARDIEPREVKNLRRNLEGVLGERDKWDTPLLRELFGVLWDGVRHRRRSADHERLWFSLAGYCLRPGFGYPLDDWRIQLLWSVHDQGVQHTRETRTWSEWWTLWRRVAGGLDRFAQQRLLEEIAPDLQPLARPARRGQGPKTAGYEDMVRLAGTLERISADAKVEVGGWLSERLKKPSESVETWWAVGRIGARVPFYGSAHSVVPAPVASGWLEQILRVDWKTAGPAAFASALIARVSGDRDRDVDAELRSRVERQLEAGGAPATWIRMVQEVVELGEADEQRVFGESLPPGLRLIH